MESIINQITQSLEDNLKCKKVKSEIVSYETVYNLKKEERNKKFDFVIRDLSDEIIALGDYIPNDSDVVGYQDLINGEAYGITHPVFYVNKGGYFILVNGSRVDIDLNLEDWLLADEFCPFLQARYPSTKRDIDIYIDKLNDEVKLLKDILEQSNLQIGELKKEKEQLETLIYKIASSISQEQKNTVKRIIDEEEEELKKRRAIPFPEKGWVSPILETYRREPFFKKTENDRIILGREAITEWSSDGQFPTWSFIPIAVIDKNGEIVKKEDYTEEENLAGQSFGSKNWIRCINLIKEMSPAKTEVNQQNSD
jgi:hypothetical protein